MTKEQYLSIRNDERSLIYFHMGEYVKIDFMTYIRMVMNWHYLVVHADKKMLEKHKINFTPSQAYQALLDYYDGMFELQLLYDKENKLIKIII